MISNRKNHKKGCLEGGDNTTKRVLEGNFSSGDGFRSKNKINSCSGCLAVILLKVSYVYQPIPSSFPGISNWVFIAIFISPCLADLVV